LKTDLDDDEEEEIKLWLEIYYLTLV